MRISHWLIPAAVAVTAAPERNLIIGLLLAGFGIKMGLFPLHAWIPLAYTATPTPIGAVLSGSMLMGYFSPQCFSPYCLLHDLGNRRQILVSPGEDGVFNPA